MSVGRGGRSLTEIACALLVLAAGGLGVDLELSLSMREPLRSVCFLLPVAGAVSALMVFVFGKITPPLVRVPLVVLGLVGMSAAIAIALLATIDGLGEADVTGGSLRLLGVATTVILCALVIGVGLVRRARESWYGYAG